MDYIKKSWIWVFDALSHSRYVVYLKILDLLIIDKNGDPFKLLYTNTDEVINKKFSSELNALSIQHFYKERFGNSLTSPSVLKDIRGRIADEEITNV